MIEKLSFEEKAPLNRYHTYGIAAKAKYLKQIHSEEELIEAFAFIKKHDHPYVFIGRGSNVLFKDDYFDGVALINKMAEFSIDGDIVETTGGMNLPLLARKVSKQNLSAFEKLVGVPGTVGGAIAMNAGVGVQEMKDHLLQVETINLDGEKKIYTNKDCGFAYRRSIFLDNGEFILKARFKCLKKEGTYEVMQQSLKKRLETQPIEERNSGCIFKNPEEGCGAGALIDQCGLKGYSIGGAEVSEKHANFINNKDSATFEDVMALVNHVQKVVKDKKGVELAFEVRII